jgi:acyl carrier protein
MLYRFENKLRELIVSCGDGVELEKINEETDIVRDFGFNSINIIQLVVEMESTFDIEVDDENLLQEKLSPYKSLVEMLRAKLSEERL